MAAPVEGLNCAVLAGTLSSDPRDLDLPSGDRLRRLEVTARTGPDGSAETVPVAWFDPPSGGPPLAAGDAVVVVGRVRRRWFGGPGGARSATEVVAVTVVPGHRRAAVRSALRRASQAIAPPAR